MFLKFRNNWILKINYVFSVSSSDSDFFFFFFDGFVSTLTDVLDFLDDFNPRSSNSFSSSLAKSSATSKSASG